MNLADYITITDDDNDVMSITELHSIFGSQTPIVFNALRDNGLEFFATIGFIGFKCIKRY